MFKRVLEQVLVAGLSAAACSVLGGLAEIGMDRLRRRLYERDEDDEPLDEPGD